jgi:hypothetical protein
MSKITTIGLDLAKNVFHVVCCDEHGKVIRKLILKRSQVLRYFTNLPPLSGGDGGLYERSLLGTSAEGTRA